jgi:Asp-tRNA(Asn)/Glu-tRNA(Gln) amidotransferase A subunit family amidase
MLFPSKAVPAIYTTEPSAATIGIAAYRTRWLNEFCQHGTMTPITSLPATEIARLLRERKVSPTEVVAAHLQQIDYLNPRLNAFVCVDFEQALEAARRAEERIMQGEHDPLLGVPISVKSSIDVAGFLTEAGSRLRKGHVSSGDAPLVCRLRNAGAIILGTTSTPEMLMAYETDNLLYGRTCNPWQVERTPGGSSGGEAVAIAAGMSAAGVGSDGGGSIRVPAHFSGICGLKPTPGRIPGTGHFPPCLGPWATIGVVGPMARTVSDLKLLLNVMAGPDDGDPVAAPVAPSGAALGQIQVGFYEHDGCGPTTKETRDAVRLAADALEDAGVRVEPFIVSELDKALRLWELVFCDGGAVLLNATIQGREAELSPILQDFLDYVSHKPPLTVESLLLALVQRDELRARFLAAMRPNRVLLAPVSSGPAFRHGEGGWGPSHPANYLETMRYSQPYNLLGLPAAVVPVSRSPEALPIGVQVIGRPYEEELVLSVAATIEAQFGFQPPPMTATDRSIL